MASGTTVLSGDILINDDMIDEALEYFVVTLTFQDPDNVPPSASIESNGGDIIRIDIIDNDGELKHNYGVYNAIQQVLPKLYIIFVPHAWLSIVT